MVVSKHYMSIFVILLLTISKVYSDCQNISEFHHKSSRTYCEYPNVWTWAFGPEGINDIKLFTLIFEKGNYNKECEMKCLPLRHCHYVIKTEGRCSGYRYLGKPHKRRDSNMGMSWLKCCKLTAGNYLDLFADVILPDCVYATDSSKFSKCTGSIRSFKLGGFKRNRMIENSESVSICSTKAGDIGVTFNKKTKKCTHFNSIADGWKISKETVVTVKLCCYYKDEAETRFIKECKNKDVVPETEDKCLKICHEKNKECKNDQYPCSDFCKYCFQVCNDPDF